jgi:hypothetical protein
MTEHKFKINNSVLGIIAIVSIVLITYMAINSTVRSNVYTQNDIIGQAFVAEDFFDYSTISVIEEYTSIPACKLIIGMTTVYDESNLAVSLEQGASVTYKDIFLRVDSINDDGCKLRIDGIVEYVSIGQIQKVGSVYITVIDVVQ